MYVPFQMCRVFLLVGVASLATAVRASAQGAVMYTEGSDLIINSPKDGDVLCNGASFSALIRAKEQVNELSSKCAPSPSPPPPAPERAIQRVARARGFCCLAKSM